MEKSEIEKSKSHIVIDILEYVPNSTVSKTILQKTTGKISVLAIDTGENLPEKTSPFDTFLQIIEGNAEVIIEDTSTILHMGEAIIVPAHTSNLIKANKRFKMISTQIKSGYEGIIL